jgi:outer membrane receptor protein involved in Fe transport
MSYPKQIIPFAAALSSCFALLLITTAPVSAQSTAVVSAPSDTTKQEQPVQLSAFEVTAAQPSAYQATTTTSGSRIAVPIFLTTQAVDVVTEQLISDLGADHMLDSAQYVSPGLNNGSQSVGADRVTIRGFQSDLHVSDGFINTDLNKGFPQINESFEIVKGPSALLSPFAPQPGGTINWITKKPSFSGDFGSASVEVGQWDSDFGSIDVNRVISPHVAIRVVAAGVDDTAYTGEPRRGGIVMPEITFRLGSAELLLQAQIYNYNTIVNSGVALDYRIGSASNVSAKNMIPSNVPWDPYIGDGDDYRDDLQHNYLAVFTDKLTDALSVRVAAHACLDQEGFRQFNTSGVVGAPSTASETNPLTGAYTPGFTYGNAASGFAATAVPIPTETGAVWARAASSSQTLGVQYDFQNDWNYEFSNSFFTSDSTAGVAVTWYPFAGNRQGSLPANGGTKVPFDYANFVGSSATVPAGSTEPALIEVGQEVDQYYVSENLKLFKDRLILSGSLSENTMKKEEENLEIPFPSPNPLQPNPASVDVDKLLKSYGIVFSPVPYAAVYYGHSETSLPVVTVNTATSTALASIPGGLLPTQDSKEDEAGIRFKTLDSRSTASVDYFQAYQSNNSVPNPANLSLLPGQVPFGLLFANVVSRGWEYEFNTAITPQLSIVGDYTHFKIANEYGQPIRAVAQSSGAVYANYQFTNGDLKGLQAGIGVVHVSRRAVDAPTAGSTAAGTTAHPIPYQPTAWLPAYTVVNLTSSYRLNAQWKVSAYADNVLNEYYFTGALNRFNVFSGPLRGYRGSVTYSF